MRYSVLSGERGRQLRKVLWAGLALLAVLVVVPKIIPNKEAPARVIKQSAPSWPDDRAKAWSVEFARAYLSQGPNDKPERISRFAADSLADSIAPEVAKRPAVIDDTVVAGATKDGVMTVAAFMGKETKYLSFKIVRQGQALAVVSLPGFVSPPARARVEPEALEMLDPNEQAPIDDLLTQFFTAYLQGNEKDLEWMTTQESDIQSLESPQLFESISNTELIKEVGRNGRLLLVTVVSKDPATETAYTQAYQVTVKKTDRWQVSAINSTQR
jgi:hypothetical protein